MLWVAEMPLSLDFHSSSGWFIVSAVTIKRAAHRFRRRGFTWTETLVVLVMVLALAQLPLRLVYREELQALDQAFHEFFGFSHLWILVPLFCSYLIYGLGEGYLPQKAA